MVTGGTIAFGSGGKWFWLLLWWLFVGEWWLCEFENREINYMNMKPKSQVCWCVAMVDMWRRLMVCWSEFSYEVIDSSGQRYCLMEEWSMWSLKKNGVWICSSRVKREFMCMWKVLKIEAPPPPSFSTVFVFYILSERDVGVWESVVCG